MQICGGVVLSCALVRWCSWHNFICIWLRSPWCVPQTYDNAVDLEKLRETDAKLFATCIASVVKQFVDK